MTTNEMKLKEIVEYIQQLATEVILGKLSTTEYTERVQELQEKLNDSEHHYTCEVDASRKLYSYEYESENVNEDTDVCITIYKGRGLTVGKLIEVRYEDNNSGVEYSVSMFV